MIQLFIAVQPLLVGAVLIWAASIKLLSRQAPAAARRSALVPLLGERRALPAYRLLGGVELAIGALLLLPPVLRWEAVAATGLTVGFLAYLTYARRAAPNSSCGCLSSQPVPVTGRGLLRAGMLVLASLLATQAAVPGSVALLERPLPGTVFLLAEAALIVALSAELDALWLLPLRRLRVRLTHPLRGGTGVPLLATVQQLQLSDAYRRAAPLLNSDVREYWDEGEWRMVCHTARYQGRPATVIFAVPRLWQDPAAVRAAIVDDATGATLWSFAGTPTPELPPQPSSGLALGTP
ncbi:MAG TPA: MauE/DoxX family redox-associated membrane protein [Micromonosporaceae bacterium]|nr:MauE/DoxX family redox-associated membrane protein [Micromonosporaceae bacterium]